MHIQSNDCSSPELVNQIKECITSKKEVSCIGPHAIFKVVEALDENTFFTTKFQNFNQMSGIVFCFMDKGNPTSDISTIEMKTSANTNVKSLGTALIKTMSNEKNNNVKISCIGKSSINQTIKGLSVFFKTSQDYIVTVEKKNLEKTPESREIVSFTVSKIN